jgi:hypothetical protein
MMGEQPPHIDDGRLGDMERYLPYCLLWVRVIVRAAYDYALWRDSKNLALRKFARTAEQWLFESSESMNSFESICTMFNLPPDKIRTWARGLTREDVKKLEFKERNGRGTMDLFLRPVDQKTKVVTDGEPE